MVEPNKRLSKIILSPPKSQANIPLYALIISNATRSLGFRKISSGQREGKMQLKKLIHTLEVEEVLRAVSRFGFAALRVNCFQ